MRYLMIDVSEHNGVIDWEAVKGAGVERAVIRVGFGGNYPNQDDKQAVRNMQECASYGIPYDVYLYSYAMTVAEAAGEAEHVLRAVDGFRPEYIWFDQEDADGYKAKHGFVPEQNGAALTDICIEFMRIIKENGYKTGVYANYDYFVNVLDDRRLMEFEGFNRWLAHWGIDEPSMDCLVWQYTSDGAVAGIDGRVDMNYFYGEMPEEYKEVVEAAEKSAGYTYNVGDMVEYNTIYVSSDSEEPLTPINTVGTITRVMEGARNPYLIDDGTGWINDDSISGIAVTDENDSSIAVGDTVVFTGEVDYNGVHVTPWHNDSGYEVMGISGDRVVLAHAGTVFAAVNVSDIERV